MKALNKYFILLITLAAAFGCRKFVEVDPPSTDLVGASVFATNANAASVLTGMLADVAASSNSFFSGNNSLSVLGSLSSDELVAYDAYAVTDANRLVVQSYKNELLSSHAPYWGELYSNIYKANAAVEGIAASTGVTMEFKNQLTGEAKFIRAFCYFYLVNLFGDVPLITAADYRLNTTKTRTPVQQVYDQIISDLKDAKTLLSEDYLDATYTVTGERVRPNKFAATALLARVYLYLGEWANSEAEATTVINAAAYGLNADQNEVFLMNSTEAIWQLPPVQPERNTHDAYYFVSDGGPSVKTPFSITSGFYNSFEAGDVRRENWVKIVITATSDTFYYPFKYKVYQLNQPVTEYLMVLRLAEQYLIRAEARAKQDNISGAQEDLDAIRSRAGLLPTTAGTKEELLTAIENERHAELFTEWGHRWLDLKRTARINDVMLTVAAQKGVEWNSNKQLFPIPVSEIQTDPNLRQNPGYN
jgi:starch-binding outer membrane protein, SusD/RagB family